MGQSGSGKTTLINLLPRFLEPESGRVMIDGRDIRDFRLGSLRSRIAFVTQDVVIFDDTLRNNLTYGLENVTDEQIREALEAASLTEMVAGASRRARHPHGRRRQPLLWRSEAAHLDRQSVPAQRADPHHG